MPLPKRSAPYIMGFLLVVMVILVVWMDRALDSEEIRSHLARPPAPLPAEQISAPAAPVVAAPVVSMAIDPANAERVSQWARNYWGALHPFSAGGGYVNFMMEEGQDRVRATYRDNYRRLATIKHKYDPANFFHINQNIKPKA